MEGILTFFVVLKNRSPFLWNPICRDSLLLCFCTLFQRLLVTDVAEIRETVWIMGYISGTPFCYSFVLRWLSLSEDQTQATTGLVNEELIEDR